MVHTGLRWSQAKVDQSKNRKKRLRIIVRKTTIDQSTLIPDYTLIANFYLFFGWLEQREDGKSNARFTASTATESAGQQDAARLLIKVRKNVDMDTIAMSSQMSTQNLHFQMRCRETGRTSSKPILAKTLPPSENRRNNSSQFTN